MLTGDPSPKNITHAQMVRVRIAPDVDTREKTTPIGTEVKAHSASSAKPKSQKTLSRQQTGNGQEGGIVDAEWPGGSYSLLR